ncbi:MAG: DUF362 domain-containing protein [Armatimonadota bacterium]|nr:DUF362 domain-containing protein [Armatimonadota bacterium]
MGCVVYPVLMLSDRSVVAVARCPSYEPESVAVAVRTVLELSGLLDRLKACRKILLKPNLLSPRIPEDAVTTHPSVVEAVGVTVARFSSEILIGDSPPFAGENPSRYATLLQKTGMSDVAHRLGAKVVRFEDQVVQVVNPASKLYRSFEVGSVVREVDVIVNIAKLKNHALTRITGAVKNLFGCVPGIRKGLFHVRAADDREVFAQMLVDLAASIGNTIHVMDAVIAMEGEGPSAGQPRQVGIILASADPIALDAVASTIVGFEPMSVDTTRLGDAQGLGCGRLDSIEVVGANIDELRVSGWLPSSGTNDWTRIPAPLRKLLKRQLLAVPVFRRDRCIGCGDCVQICAAKALTVGRPPTLDAARCIRCYCCHEICSSRAIDLRYGTLARLLGIHRLMLHTGQ